MANNGSGGIHDDYLNAPDTAGRPMALVSLIIVFLVIAAIALAVFIGGRWVYNEYIADDSSGSSDVITEEGQDSGTNQDNTTDTSGDQSANNGDTTTDTSNQSEGQGSGSVSGGTGSGETSSSTSSQGTSSDNSSSDNQGSPNTATTDTGTSDSNGSQTATTTAVTGPSESEEVPNTGPESLIGIFAVTTLIAALLHRKWLISRTR